MKEQKLIKIEYDQKDDIFALYSIRNDEKDLIISTQCQASAKYPQGEKNFISLRFMQEVLKWIRLGYKLV